MLLGGLEVLTSLTLSLANGRICPLLTLTRLGILGDPSHVFSWSLKIIIGYPVTFFLRCVLRWMFLLDLHRSIWRSERSDVSGEVFPNILDESEEDISEHHESESVDDVDEEKTSPLQAILGIQMLRATATGCVFLFVCLSTRFKCLEWFFLLYTCSGFQIVIPSGTLCFYKSFVMIFLCGEEVQIWNLTARDKMAITLVLMMIFRWNKKFLNPHISFFIQMISLWSLCEDMVCYKSETNKQHIRQIFHLNFNQLKIFMLASMAN